MSKRFSYANVAATLALFFAMSGGALAAKHYLINSTKQINPKVLKALKGKEGAAGKEGKEGKEGKAGQEGKEGPPGKNASASPVAWTELVLENGWEVRKSLYGAPLTYTKDAQGFVHLSGALNGEKSSSGQIAVLPAGFRPTRVAFAWLRTASTNGAFDPHLVDVEIRAETGAIVAYAGAEAKKSFVSFEGITFYAG